MKLSLFSRITLILCFCFVSVAYAEAGENETPLDLSIGSIRTEAEKAAVGFLVRYAENIDKEYLITNADPKNTNVKFGWLFDISPEVEIQVGDEDAFNGIVAKLTGNYIRFSTIKIADNYTPCSDCYFSVFPMSIGFESDRNFENVSALFEVGYVPYFLKSETWKLGIKSKVGVFLQAGYKFEVDDTPEEKKGGAVNESAEEPDSEIVRIKLDAGTQIGLFSYSNRKPPVSFVPRIRLWYDAINSEVYHKLESSIKFPLGKDKSFDLKYENGSGAPNFNEGEQFSANISIKF